MKIRKSLYNKIEDVFGKDCVLNRDVKDISKNVVDYIKNNASRAGKFLLYTIPTAAMLFLNSCTLKSPIMPTERTVTANQTMFANTGTSYILSSPYPGQIEWKRPCDSAYTAGNVVPMQDDCYGTLETKVGGATGSKLTIYKGESMTDGEVNAALAAKVVAGKVNAGFLTNVDQSGYNWDATFVRTNDGKQVWVYAIGTNIEKNNIPPSAPSAGDILLVINEGTDIATAINNVTP